jgi:hypothetical protein
MLAALGAVLSGCGDDAYKQTAKKDPAFADDLPTVASAQPTVPIPPLPSGDLRADLGITTERYGDYSNRDLVEKADIYWKLYYMTKALQEGHPSPETVPALQAVKAAMRKLHPDKNVTAIESIVKLIDTGLSAQNLEESLSRRGIRTASLGWSGGEYDLTRELRPTAHDVPGETGKRPKVSDSDARLAASFAGRFHKAPALVRQESFQQAAELANQLGDTLDEERSQAGAHPIGRDKVDPSAGLANPYASAFPSPPIR